MDQSNIQVSSQSQSQQLDQNLSELRKDVQLSPTKLRQITNTSTILEKQQFNSIITQNKVYKLEDPDKPQSILDRLKEYYSMQQIMAKQSIEIQSSTFYITKPVAIKKDGYLQALIYNYNTYLKNNQSSLVENNNVQNRKSKQLVTIQSIERKNQLAKYYLQFQIINSQENNHSGALVAGRKAVQILKSNFRQIYVVSKRLKKSPYQKKFDVQLRSKIIDYNSRLNDSFSFSDTKNILNAALYYLKLWNQHINSKDKQKDRNYVLQEQFKHYSIGNPLNLIPMLYQQAKQQRQKNFSAKNILQKFLALSVSYFTIATQLRYISNQKYKNNQIGKKASSQFKQSQIYHLLSIVLVSYFVPFDILLMKHIINSFQTNYGLKLLDMINNVSKNQLQNYGGQRQSEKYQAFLFPQSNRVNQASSSILVSGIADNHSSYQQQKQDNNLTTHNSGGGSNRTIKKMQNHFQDSQATHSKDMEFTMNSLNRGKSPKMHSSPNTYNKIVTQPNSSKKIKPTPNKNKSKSKSKNKIFLNTPLINQSNKKQEQYGNKSPVPKSPRAHNLRDSRSIVKIKTTHRLKISTEKIQYRKEGQKQKKSPTMNFDYFTSKSKDLKKSSNMKSSQIMQSPKAHNTSKSSSRRQSPVPNYFQPLKTGRKTIKSPKPENADNPYTVVKPKLKKKSQKLPFHQYYL